MSLLFHEVRAVVKMTGETPEVRSDKRKPREKKERENERKQEKTRETERKKGEKERKKEKKDVQGQLLSNCIQFAKRKKTIYMAEMLKI